jgi:endogenous inhibitor of DNA gyrase (YacG/DUF329 family)
MKEFEFGAVQVSALPFCSARCKQIDLARWLDERNPLSVKTQPADEDAEFEPADDGDCAA